MIPETTSEKKRQARCTNIAMFLLGFYFKRPKTDRPTSVSAASVRSGILSLLGATPASILGDRRAHGDALHELGVDRLGGDVFLNSKTIQACLNHLSGEAIHEVIRYESVKTIRRLFYGLTRLKVDVGGSEKAIVAIVKPLTNNGYPLSSLKSRYLAVITHKNEAGAVVLDHRGKKVDTVLVYKRDMTAFGDLVDRALVGFYEVAPSTATQKKMDLDAAFESNLILEGHFRNPHLKRTRVGIKACQSAIPNGDLLPPSRLAQLQQLKTDRDAVFAATLAAHGGPTLQNFHEIKADLDTKFAA